MFVTKIVRQDLLQLCRRDIVRQGTGHVVAQRQPKAALNPRRLLKCGDGRHFGSVARELRVDPQLLDRGLQLQERDRPGVRFVARTIQIRGSADGDVSNVEHVFDRRLHSVRVGCRRDRQREALARIANLEAARNRRVRCSSSVERLHLW